MLNVGLDFFFVCKQWFRKKKVLETKAFFWFKCESWSEDYCNVTKEFIKTWYMSMTLSFVSHNFCELAIKCKIMVFIYLFYFQFIYCWQILFHHTIRLAFHKQQGLSQTSGAINNIVECCYRWHQIFETELQFVVLIKVNTNQNRNAKIRQYAPNWQMTLYQNDLIKTLKIIVNASAAYIWKYL